MQELIYFIIITLIIIGFSVYGCVDDRNPIWLLIIPLVFVIAVWLFHLYAKSFLVVIEIVKKGLAD